MKYIETFFTNLGFKIDRIEPIEYIPLVDVYRIDNGAITTFFRWSVSDNDMRFFKLNQHKVKSLLLRGIKFDNHVYDYNSLQAFIDKHYPNLTPEDKLNSIVEYVNSFSDFEGQFVTIKIPDDNQANCLFFKEAREWLFYFDTATEQGLIEKQYGAVATYRLTLKGLATLIHLNEGKRSNICFVAMAFANDMFDIYDKAIEPAIIATGFKPLIIDRIHIESDTTINDAILAGIKKAKFTIADFTYHKGGVYFEAGYALGRGQKVIYTCREDQFKDTHFDINHYQHIIWTSPEALQKRLIDKIEAFVKD